MRTRGGFFFSSRRRHTSCLSDWSSDVCSSDLALVALYSATKAFDLVLAEGLWYELRDRGVDVVRSEERRVGKECRSRRSPPPSTRTNKTKTGPTWKASSTPGSRKAGSARHYGQ